MKKKSLQFIIELIKHLKEEGGPTNSVGAGGINGLSGKEGDLPPVDLRKKKYRRLPPPYKALYRRSFTQK